MTATVISLDSHRRNQERACYCADDFVCYPHRLIDLAARIEDARGDVEQIRFCDYSTFNRLTADVLAVLASITDDCLPANERTAK